MAGHLSTPEQGEPWGYEVEVALSMVETGGIVDVLFLDGVSTHPILKLKAVGVFFNIEAET